MLCCVVLFSFSPCCLPIITRGWTWNEETKKGSCMFIFRGHQGSVRVLELWNGFLLSGSQDGSIKAWDDRGRMICFVRTWATRMDKEALRRGGQVVVMEGVLQEEAERETKGERSRGRRRRTAGRTSLVGMPPTSWRQHAIGWCVDGDHGATDEKEARLFIFGIG